MGSTNRFIGLADVVAQVDTFTPANVEVDDIFTLTITAFDGKTCAVSFTATATTVANVTAGLTAAWNASKNPLCTPVTAADNTTNLTLTADTAGVAFSVAATTTNGGGTDDQTLTRAATTKNEGPNDYSSVDNWSLGAVPAATDDVYIEGATVLYGLSQSGATYDSLHITQSQIGSNPADGHLAQYLACEASVVDIGYHNGPGKRLQSAPINLNLGTVASVVTIHNTGTNGIMPAVRIKANKNTTTLEVKKGSVGVAYESGETTTIGPIISAYTTNKESDVNLFIGDGCTLTTIDQKGGNLVLRSACTTLTVDAGALKTEGSGAIPTFIQNGGKATLNSTGTMGGTGGITVNGGQADWTKSSADRTLTDLKINPGGSIKLYPSVHATITWADPDEPVTLTASAA